MTLLDSLAFMTIMLTLAAIPSTSVALVVTRAAASGLWHGVAVTVGIVVGDLTLALLAILGLTALAELMGTFFLLIRYAAGLYLIVLGIQLIRSRNQGMPMSDRDRSPVGLFGSVVTGLLVTLGDVKAIFFYASLFPTFLDLAALNYGEILTVLAIIVATVGGVKLTYAIVARKVAAIALRFPLAKPAKTTSGIVMIGSGTYLIVSGR